MRLERMGYYLQKLVTVFHAAGEMFARDHRTEFQQCVCLTSDFITRSCEQLSAFAFALMWCHLCDVSTERRITSRRSQRRLALAVNRDSFSRFHIFSPPWLSFFR